MTPESWQQVKEICLAALDLPASERVPFVKHHCAGRQELEEAALRLVTEPVPTHFIEPPIENAAQHLLATGAATLEAGTTIGPFKLLEPIGSGGIGDVYRALYFTTSEQTEVALKLIQRGMVTPDVLRRFREEHRLLARLQHPHIARCVDGGIADGRAYLAMEFVDGQPVDMYCDKQRMTVPQRLDLFRKVCDAVAFAHQNLIVHRDLKPRNILVTPQGVPKLLDFGVAKLMADDSVNLLGDPTVTARPMITPQYASPEQLRGEPVSTASDVYSLGVILYELLCGHRPYRHERLTAAELQQHIAETPPQPPSRTIGRADEIRRPAGTTELITPQTVTHARSTDANRLQRDLRGDLDTIVLKAMHLVPERRYATVGQLSDDIERYLGGHPVRALPDSISYRTRKFIRRHTFAVTALTLTTLSLALGAMGLGVGLGRARREAAHATQKARESARVLKFLSDMLSSVNPITTDHAARADELTVREVLSRASDELQRGALGAEPQIEAAIAYVIGQTYRSLGLYEAAEVNLNKALLAHRSLPSTDPADLANSLTEWGRLKRDVGRYDEAEAALRESLALRIAVFGEDHAAVADNLDDLGKVLRARGLQQEAEDTYRRCLSLRRKLLPAESREIGDVLNNLGMLLTNKGEYKDAEPMLRESIAIYRTTLPESHPFLATAINNLGLQLLRNGDLGEAESLLRESLAIQEQSLGPGHPNTAVQLGNLGLLHIELGHLDTAESFYRRALELRLDALDEKHPSVATSRLNLASVLHAQGKLQDALAMDLQVLEVWRSTLGDTHPSVANCLDSLAKIALDMTDLETASMYAHESLQIRSTVLPLQHPDVAGSKLTLARILLAQGEPEEARPLLEETVVIFEQRLPEDHWRTAWARILLASCRAALEDPGASEALLINNLRSIRERFGDTHFRTKEALQVVGQFYDKWGMPEKAAQYFGAADGQSE